jgi:predicted RNase H-like HicB family nuclease
VGAQPALKLSTIDHTEMSTQRTKLTPVYREVEDGWIHAEIAEMPNVLTCGRDQAEAEWMLKDALREYLLALEDDGEAPPEGVDELSLG